LLTHPTQTPASNQPNQPQNEGCLVGLQPIDKDLYKDTHKISYMNTVIAHKGDNLERYIIGRQFNVVLCVFVVSLVRRIAEEGGQVIWLPVIFCLTAVFVHLLTGCWRVERRLRVLF